MVFTIFLINPIRSRQIVQTALYVHWFFRLASGCSLRVASSGNYTSAIALLYLLVTRLEVADILLFLALLLVYLPVLNKQFNCYAYLN